MALGGRYGPVVLVMYCTVRAGGVAGAWYRAGPVGAHTQASNYAHARAQAHPQRLPCFRFEMHVRVRTRGARAHRDC
jgi:hypothetical protein